MPQEGDAITFNPTAKTVTIQPATPAPTEIDGATYIANLEAEVTLQTQNAVQEQQQQQAQWDATNVEIAATLAKLDAAITALQEPATQLDFPSQTLTDALAAQAARPALIAAADIAVVSPSERMQA